MTLDEATRRHVRETQLAWFSRWLEGEDARQAWVRMVGHAVTMALSSPPSTLIDESSLDRLIAAALASETIANTIAPAVVAAVAETALRARTLDETPAGLLGPDAARAIDRVAELPDLASEAVVHAILTSSAVEQLVGEHLFDAINIFSRKVNPFVAEWGLPALLNALPLLGRGAIKTALGGVHEEFERRLEPETRRFITGFVKQSLQKAERELTTRSGAPEHVRLRKEIATAVMKVPLREFVWDPRSEIGQRVLAAVNASVRHTMGHPSVREALENALADVLKESATVGEILGRYGIAVPPVEELADATLPAVRRVLALPAVQEELGNRIDESLGGA